MILRVRLVTLLGEDSMFFFFLSKSSFEFYLFKIKYPSNFIKFQFHQNIIKILIDRLWPSPLTISRRPSSIIVIIDRRLLPSIIVHRYFIGRWRQPSKSTWPQANILFFFLFSFLRFFISSIFFFLRRIYFFSFSFPFSFSMDFLSLMK